MDQIAATGTAVDDALIAGRDAAIDGATTRDVGLAVERSLERSNAMPALRVVRDRGGPAFPGVCCVCVNEELSHSPPRERVLRAGDLVSIDVAAAVEAAGGVGGWHADAACSFAVGDDAGRGNDLAAAARRVVLAAMGAAAPGGRWSVISRAARGEAERCGVRIVPGFAGHGIGQALHEPPAASFDTEPIDDVVLRPGMVLTIEPIVTDGSGSTITLDDGWTVLAADRAWGCHEERTIGVTRDGIRVLAGGDWDDSDDRSA
ncbi:MAG: M24 family metallopeptidase [Planctomycetota bacterium]